MLSYAGGTSGLGMMVANMLRLSSARHMIVLGRTAHAIQSIETDLFGKSHGSITVLRADVSCPSEAREAVHSSRFSMQYIGGVLHAAGLQVHSLAFLTQSSPCPVHGKSIIALLCNCATRVLLIRAYK